MQETTKIFKKNHLSNPSPGAQENKTFGLKKSFNDNSNKKFGKKKYIYALYIH